MFRSINLLFLICLAFMSWFILCFLKHVEDQRNGYLEEIKWGTSMPACTGYCENDHLEVYLNFFFMIACIYALGKTFQLLEKFITQRMNENKAANSENISSDTSKEQAEKFRQEKEDMLVQIACLQKENLELERELKEKKYMLSTILDVKKPIVTPLDKPVLAIEDVIPTNNNALSNIYISNRHIHLNRQVFVNDGKVNINFNDEHKKFEHSQIDGPWEKYLKLQNNTPSIKKNEDAKNKDAKAVKIVATADLHEIHGLILL